VKWASRPPARKAGRRRDGESDAVIYQPVIDMRVREHFGRILTSSTAGASHPITTLAVTTQNVTYATRGRAV
jgi:hypothetical protein